MNKIEDFLSYLRDRDVQLWIDGSSLRCSAPKETLTLDLRNELARRKAEILAFLQEANLAASLPYDPIPSVPRNQDLLLSFAQQRLWFLAQLEGESAAYNELHALQISGEVQINLLEQSLTEIVRRHEVLRTIFREVDSSPVQIVLLTVPVNILVVDLQALPAGEQLAEVQRVAIQQAQQPFDLVNGPLLKVTLLRLGEDTHVLILTIHHIICDGWSMGILIHEFSALYAAFSKGEPTPLPELPIQYADFANWQRVWLQGQVLETQLNYWQQQLAGCPPLLELPTDRPRSPVQSFRGNRQYFEINWDITQQLKRLSQQSGTTLFMTLLAAFVTLLFRYTGVQDIVVGSPIANRNRREMELLIGLFVNTLVLRVNLEENPSFSELLTRVRQVALDAYAHQDLLFEKLVESLQLERSLSYHPVFQVMFVLQNPPMGKLELSGMTLTPLAMETGTAKFDLFLSMEETELGLRATWEYNSDLFDATTITRMIGHFQNLLSGIVVNPLERISELPLLTATEQQLLVEWNNTQSNYPQNKCIHQLFEEQVEQTPDAVAVLFEDVETLHAKSLHITYRDLNRRANQLAHHLQKLEVGPEVLVGICMDRSLEMVVGMLGILKAGGAYVPLDPQLPQDRLAFMLTDASVPVLLTQQSLVEKLPSHKALLVCLDTDKEVINRESEQTPTNSAIANNLAYVIYTSGSTGWPKGVQISHRSVVNVLSTIGQQPGMTQQDVLLGVTTFNFDIAGLEIFLPITVGARLVMASREVTSDGTQLLDLLVKSGATVMQATPATWRLLLEASWQTSHPLKILCGGEALPWNLANQLLARSTSLWNLYGPTETTIWSVISKVESESGLITIGRPIANTQVYVLDNYLQPVPIGVRGELYIGGDGLARGYLNRPELTQEKFIPNIFSDEPGAYLYKTGDLACYLPDGNIEFLGRIDDQVKIRGFRIELGEIEAILTQHPKVREVVVIARVEISGDKRLVAYVIPIQEQKPNIDELRNFLKQKLPEYMIPSAFIWLNALPLSPNGKLDRAALPVPEQIWQEPEEAFVAHRDELELQIKEIWEEVLSIKPISIRDNFFDLGGHSLLAVRLFAQIEKRFGKNLPLATLFQAGTIEELAKIIRHEEWLAPWSSLVAIQPGGSQPPLFYVHAGGGNLLVYRDLGFRMGSDQPVYGLQPRGLDGKYAPHTRIEDMATHYLALMRNRQPDGPYFLAGLSTGGLVALEIARQIRTLGQEVALLTLFDTYGPKYPKLLPPVPRFLSVLRWAAFDFVHRLILLPVKVVDKLRELGIKETWNKILGKLAIFKRKIDKDKIDEDQMIQMLHVQRETDFALDEYSRNSSHLSNLEKFLNSLIFFILNKSSRSYYANIFVRILSKSLSPLPKTLQKVQEANIQAAKAYVAQAYPGRAILFRASKQPPGIYRDPYLGWGEIFTGGIEIHEVPGTHDSIIKSSILAEKLRACIERRSS